MYAGHRLYERAKVRIPGGTQLLSKRPEMLLPGGWPAYYSRAAGAEVWDLDGRRFIDMSYSGIGACVLGFADPDVDAAVREAIGRGSMSTLNCAEEVRLADVLCELHPWAEMVRFARGGGEAMAIAVRIARAHTGRDLVAFCGYHGWHDWYLAANLHRDDALDGHLLPGLLPAGVPRALAGTAIPFGYDAADQIKAIVAAHRSELAAIVMEPVRNKPAAPRFLKYVRALADEAGAVLILDEVTSGWRLTTGGAHLVYGITPDIAVFAKAMGNGYPMAAVIGRANVMEAAEGTFISSTCWTERIGPVAALATIRKHRALRVAEHLVATGEAVQQIWRNAARDAGIAIEVTGIPPLAHFEFPDPHRRASRTLFTQLMLERGFLATSSFYAMFAHRPEHLDGYKVALRDAFRIVAEAWREGKTERLLAGPVAHATFARLT